ncbi:MAG: MFS transporter, partial [Pseudomonadota bacterium]|nr:MFS transporter [Pseudomonadota bacterium]
VVASKFGLKAIFALIMALTFLALLLLVLLLPNAPAKPNRENSPVKHMLTRVFYNSGLASMYFSIFLLHFVYTSLFIELPAILVSSLNLTVESHWLFYAKTILLSLVFLIPALYYAEKKAVTKELIVVAIFTFFLSFFVLTFYNQSHLLITAIVTLFFAGFSFLESVLPSLTSKCSPVALRGTAMGIFSSCQFLGIFLGGLIAGFFQEYFGQQAYFFFVSFLLLIWFFTSKGLSIGDFSECSFDFDYRDRSFFRGIKNELSHLNGVIKVFYVKDEKKIYIKFDNSITSSAELKQNISLYVNRL